MNKRVTSQSSKRGQDRRSRRAFLASVGVAGGIAAISGTFAAQSPQSAMAKRDEQPSELFYLSATRLAEMIRTKEVSSEDVVRAHIARINAVNPKLNAMVYVAEEHAINRAREADRAIARGEDLGLLHGVPITVKDSAFVAGMITTGGTLGRKDFIPVEDHPMVARLRSAGAIVLGKTNCPELSFAFETDNLVYGRTNNPWDVTRTPGGSTGGEAAIIAVGGSPLGIGGDAGGSIRLPAHFCGITGVKPTWGMVPIVTHGIVGGPAVGGYLVQGGPLARSVEDLALALSLIVGSSRDDAFAMANPPIRDWRKVSLRNLRVAFHLENGIVAPTLATQNTVRRAAEALSSEVLAIEENTPPRIEETYELYGSLTVPNAVDAFRNALKSHGTEQTSALIEEYFAFMRRYEAERNRRGKPIDPVQTEIDWRTFNQTMAAFMSSYDVMLCPVHAYPAIKHGTSLEHIQAFSYTMTFNLTGNPAAVVRCGTSPEGLPIGVQIVGPMFREDIVFAVAEYLEKALGGWQPPPV